MRVLIVYENVPESTDFFLVEPTPKEWEWMQKTHGWYVNSDIPKENDKACQKLSNYLQNCEKLTVAAPFDVAALKIDFVIQTGFVM